MLPQLSASAACIKRREGERRGGGRDDDGEGVLARSDGNVGDNDEATRGGVLG